MCKYLIILNWFWYPVYDKISNFIFLYVWSIYWRLFPIVWLLVPSLVIMMSKCLSSLPTLFHSAMCLPLVSYCFDTVALYYILKPGVVRPLALFFLFKITLSLNNDFWFIKSIFFSGPVNKNWQFGRDSLLFWTQPLDGNTYFWHPFCHHPFECASCPISCFWEESTCIELRLSWFLQIFIFIKPCA